MLQLLHASSQVLRLRTLREGHMLCKVISPQCALVHRYLGHIATASLQDKTITRITGRFCKLANRTEDSRSSFAGPSTCERGRCGVVRTTQSTRQISVTQTRCWSQQSDGSEQAQSGLTMNVHPLAKDGFVKGDAYHAHRVSYTPETVARISDCFKQLVSSTPKASHYDVLELGAGTGKFTQVFLPALPQGTRYLATEPSSSFLDTLKQVLPGLEAREASGSNIPLPDSSVKFVVCAQSFHWFCDEASVREIRRVLTPDGKLVVVWNQYDVSVPWFKAVRSVMVADQLDSPPAILDSGQWKDAILAYPGFGQHQDMRLPGIENKGTVEAVLSQLHTSSLMSALSEGKRNEMSETIRGIIRKEFGDDSSTIVQVPMYTQIVIFPCA